MKKDVQNSYFNIDVFDGVERGSLEVFAPGKR